MSGWPETTQTCGTWRRNFPHSVHGVCTKTATIDVHEVCNVRICDIPGDIISTDMDKDAKMALRGRLAEQMVNIDPQIDRHHVIYDKGRLVL